MFGIFRFILALLVVINHIAGIPYAGPFAVFGFFILSGYLMTLVMHRTYGYTVAGFRRFAINRVLRIYPTYYLALIAAAIVLIVFGGDAGRPLSIHYRFPINPSGLLANLALLNLSPDHARRLVAPAWTLQIELTFYILIGLGLARTRMLTLAWFGVSLILTAWAWSADLSWTERYGTLTAGSLPFSAGALLYHLRGRLKVPPARLPLLFIITSSLFAANLMTAIWQDTGHGNPFYISFACSLLIVIFLMHIRPSGWVAATDRLLGNLSYPIYLLHQAVGAACLALLGLSRGWELFVVTLPFILLASLVAHVFLEHPIERLRNRVRGDMSSPSPSRARFIPGQRST